MDSIFLDLAVHVLSNLPSGFSSHVCFLQPLKALTQGRKRMVDKLIATEGWGVMCVLVLPNTTNLLNREVIRLLSERAKWCLCSLIQQGVLYQKKEGWQGLVLMYFWNNKIDLIPSTCHPHLKRAKYIFQIHILHIPQGIKDKWLFPLHLFFSYTP